MNNELSNRNDMLHSFSQQCDKMLYEINFKAEIILLAHCFKESWWLLEFMYSYRTTRDNKTV